MARRRVAGLGAREKALFAERPVRNGHVAGPVPGTWRKWTVVHVELPEPFDFELTTERFRAFGDDPANVWSDGRLHRVFGGVEAAIAPAPGGVAVEPPDPALVEPVHRFLGGSFDLEALARRASEDAVVGRLVGALRGLRPSLVPDPFEMLVGSVTAQQVSLRA